MHHIREYPAIVLKERELVRAAIRSASQLGTPLPEWISGFVSDEKGHKCPVARPTAWGGYRGRAVRPRVSESNVELSGGISDE